MDIHSAEFVKGVVSLAGLPATSLPEVAFAGRSNVGKSSLVNMLLSRRNLARTSGQPGKTQEINFFRINDAFHLVDLPGYGYARVSKTRRDHWLQLIGDYVASRAQLRALVHLVDARHPPTTLDTQVMDYMRGGPTPYLLVLTKVDKLSGNERTKSVARVKTVLDERAMSVPVLPTSAKSGRGRDAVWEWIKLCLGLS